MFLEAFTKKFLRSNYIHIKTIITKQLNKNNRFKKIKRNILKTTMLGREQKMIEYLVTKNTTKEDVSRIIKRNILNYLKIYLVNIQEPEFIKYNFFINNNIILFMEKDSTKNNQYLRERFEAKNEDETIEYVYEKLQNLSFENYWEISNEIKQINKS